MLDNNDVRRILVKLRFNVKYFCRRINLLMMRKEFGLALLCIIILNSKLEETTSYREALNGKPLVETFSDAIIEMVENLEDHQDTIISILAEKARTPEEIIKDKYNLSDLEFKTIVGVVLAEAKANSYEDAYAVINTIYNRTKSKSWIYEMERVMGRTDGDNLFVQVICPGQFQTYGEETYKKYWENTDCPGYQAIIDFLLTEESMHNYLYFWGDCLQRDGSEQFVSHGNRYFNPMPEEDRVETLKRKLG